MSSNKPQYDENGILTQLRKHWETNGDIAEHLGVTRTTLPNWENKATWPVWALVELGFSIVYDYDETIEEMNELKELVHKLEESLKLLARPECESDPLHILETKQKLKLFSTIL